MRSTITRRDYLAQVLKVRSDNTALAPYRFDFKAMGTRCDIRIFAGDVERASNAIHAAVKEINRLEKKYSRYRPDNFMHQLNAAAGNGGVIDIDDECRTLLDFADACHRQSDGLFDITSGILRKVWNFDDPRLPDSSLLERTLACVGWQHVVREWNTVRFARAGMELDFGGIVKEYAADRAAQICRQHNIHHGVVDMGGDIIVIGPNPDGQPWSIGIRHPRVPEVNVATLDISRGAVATSGDYERCIDIDGVRYSHILSPRTGWPVQGLASVTVVVEQCIIAGSLCTTAMLKEKDGSAWLEGLGVPHVWIDVDGEIGGTRPGVQNGVRWHHA